MDHSLKIWSGVCPLQVPKIYHKQEEEARKKLDDAVRENGDAHIAAVIASDRGLLPAEIAAEIARRVPKLTEAVVAARALGILAEYACIPQKNADGTFPIGVPLEYRRDGHSWAVLEAARISTA